MLLWFIIFGQSVGARPFDFLVSWWASCPQLVGAEPPYMRAVITRNVLTSAITRADGEPPSEGSVA